MTPEQPEEDRVDAELERLVSRLLDHCLTDEESRRLEQRLRDEPAAHRYCSECLRFDASLQETLDPAAVTFEETRRVVFDPKQTGKIWSVQREQTLRFGSANDAKAPPPPVKSRWPFWLAGLLILGTAAGTLVYWQIAAKTYELRNGDFEAMDLSKSPTGVDQSLLNWQDYFSSQGTELLEIGRVTGGKIYAKSGRNAVKLADRSFINQLILNRQGDGLQATPETRVIVEGWYFAEMPDSKLRCSLRYVASGYPNMIQYEAAANSASLEAGGWHFVRVELKIPDQLWRSPSDLSTSTGPAPAIDLNGKKLTLSLDHFSGGGVLYLDDLSMKVIPAGN